LVRCGALGRTDPGTLGERKLCWTRPQIFNAEKVKETGVDVGSQQVRWPEVVSKRAGEGTLWKSDCGGGGEFVMAPDRQASRL